jgi:hypothetical protein
MNPLFQPIALLSGCLVGKKKVEKKSNTVAAKTISELFGGIID